MPEIDDFFAPVIRDAGRTVWDEPAEVRRRGTSRRTRRRVAAAGLAALVVVGLGVGAAWAVGRPPTGPDAAVTPEASPSGTPSPTPSTPRPSTTGPTATSTSAPAAPTAIPEAAMLRASDVGAGYTVSDQQEGDDHGSIGMLMSYCGQGDHTSAGEHALTLRKRNLSNGDERYLLEEVVRYEGSWASRHLADLRAALPRCPTVDIMGDPNARASLTVVATNFTGDGAILVKETRGGQTQYHAVVYRGDVAARLRIHTGATQTQARNITRLASERLCAAVPSC